MNIKGLSLIALGCLLIIIWINFFDFKFAEWFIGIGPRVESIIEVLCRSFIAAYIFFFINVYLRDKKEKKEILPFVANRVYFIILNNHSIINALKKDSDLSVRYFPDEKEFRDLLASVDPNSKAPFYYQKENWIYLFRNRQE